MEEMEWERFWDMYICRKERELLTAAPFSKGFTGHIALVPLNFFLLYGKIPWNYQHCWFLL